MSLQVKCPFTIGFLTDGISTSVSVSLKHAPVQIPLSGLQAGFDLAVNVPTGVQAVTDANGNPVVASLSGSTLSLTFANAADATSAQGTFTF